MNRDTVIQHFFASNKLLSKAEHAQIKSMLSIPADENSLVTLGEEILYSLICCKRLDRARYMIQEFGVSPNSKHPLGNSLLGSAIITKNLPMALLLLECDADPNGKVDCPLRYCFWGEDENIAVQFASLLIKHGANVHVPLWDCNVFPVGLAIHSQWPEMVQLLFKQGNGNKADRFGLNERQYYYIATRMMPGIERDSVETHALLHPMDEEQLKIAKIFYQAICIMRNERNASLYYYQAPASLPIDILEKFSSFYSEDDYPEVDRGDGRYGFMCLSLRDLFAGDIWANVDEWFMPVFVDMRTLNRNSEFVMKQLHRLLTVCKKLFLPLLLIGEEDRLPPQLQYVWERYTT